MNIVGLCCLAMGMAAVADEAKPAEAPAGVVATAAQKLTVLNGKVNPDAQVYYYIHSASWCGPCKRAMPGVVKAYEEIKADGRAEVILVSYDKTPELAKKYVDSYKTEMPAVHCQDAALRSLPGFSYARIIPAVQVTDAQGKVLGQGSPMLIMQWKEQVK